MKNRSLKIMKKKKKKKINWGSKIIGEKKISIFKLLNIDRNKFEDIERKL